MDSEKSGSPACGIYVRIDDFSDMTEVTTSLRQIAMVINRASGYEKNMSVIELSCAGANTNDVTTLVKLLQAQGLVTLVSGIDVNDFDTFGADGLILDESYDNEIREQVSEDAIIGLKCETSDQVKSALNYDLDIAILRAKPSEITSWANDSEVFCVASGEGINQDTCAGLVRAGAHFVDASQYIFNHDKGILQGTVNIMHALETAAQS